MATVLSSAQLQEMQVTFKLGTVDANYAGMYQFIFDEVGD